MSYIEATLTAILLFSATVFIHAEGIGAVGRKLEQRGRVNQVGLASVVTALLALHILEIMLYAAAIWILNIGLDIGDIAGAREFAALDYFYYSAETFTALGSGDLAATGALRLIASLEPLNGLVLIAWTGAFTYYVMEHDWKQSSNVAGSAGYESQRKTGFELPDQAGK